MLHAFTKKCFWDTDWGKMSTKMKAVFFKSRSISEVKKSLEDPWMSRLICLSISCHHGLNEILCSLCNTGWNTSAFPWKDSEHIRYMIVSWEHQTRLRNPIAFSPTLRTDSVLMRVCCCGIQDYDQVRTSLPSSVVYGRSWLSFYGRFSWWNFSSWEFINFRTEEGNKKIKRPPRKISFNIQRIETFRNCTWLTKSGKKRS